MFSFNLQRIEVSVTFACYVPKACLQRSVSCIRIPLDLEFVCLICIENTDEHVTCVGTGPTLDPEETTAVQVSYLMFVFC